MDQMREIFRIYKVRSSVGLESVLNCIMVCYDLVYVCCLLRAELHCSEN